MTMTDTENKALYIAEQCRAAGMTMAGVAGVLANVGAESAFKSDNLQDCYQSRLGMDDATYTQRVDNGTYQGFVSDAAGYGLAQTTASDRKAKMLAFHRQRGASIGDFATQVDFILSEMRGYGKAWQTCTGGSNAYECGYAVCKYYEIPADTENQARYRGGLAQKWYDWLYAMYQQGMPAVTVGESTAEQSGTGEGNATSETQSAAESTGDGKTGKLKLRMIGQGIEGWPEVWLAQAALKQRGYNVQIDGIYAKHFAEKTKEFQRAAGLEADGVIGPLTWAALLEM